MTNSSAKMLLPQGATPGQLIDILSELDPNKTLSQEDGKSPLLRFSFTGLIDFELAETKSGQIGEYIDRLYGVYQDCTLQQNTTVVIA